MNQNELTAAAETHTILVDGIIAVLTKVQGRFACEEDVVAISASLARLKANRDDKAALAEAFAYCSDHRIVGPIN